MPAGTVGSTLPTTVNLGDILTPTNFADEGATTNALWQTLLGTAATARSFMGIVIDGTGGAAVTPAARQISCTGGQLDVVGYAATGVRATQSVQTSGSPTTFTVTRPAHTTLTADTESICFDINTSATVQWTSGAGWATQRETLFRAPTYAFSGAGTTITSAATVAIAGAPAAGAGATITNAYSLWVQGGTTYLGGPVTHASTTLFNQFVAASASVWQISDPGNGNAIDVTYNGICNLTSGAGAETRTMAIPTFIGQTIGLCMDTDGGGNIVITVAAAINQAGNTQITMDAAADSIFLVAMTVGGARRWRVVYNDGCALA
jgi:hypothetical protein